MDYLIAAYAAVMLVEGVIWGREIPWALTGMMRARERVGQPLLGIWRIPYFGLFLACSFFMAALWPLILVFTQRGLFHPYNRFSVIRQAMRGVYMAHPKR